MPGSRASVFGEAEDFQAALGTDGVARMLFTGRGPFRARLTQIELERLRLAVVEEAQSRIAFVVVPTGRVLVSFLIDRGPAPQIADYGRAVRGTRLVLPPAVRWRPPRARSGMVHTETSPLSLRVVWIAQACFSGLVKDELLGRALQDKGLAGSVDHDFIAESRRREPPLGRKGNRGREIASGSRPRP